MWRAGKAWPDILLDIEAGAKLTVAEDEKRGPRFARWRPSPHTLPDTVSCGAASPLERGKQISALDPA